jgi:hypothetical protein
MPQGTVKHWRDDKGFGFTRLDVSVTALIARTHLYCQRHVGYDVNQLRANA